MQATFFIRSIGVIRQLYQQQPKLWYKTKYCCQDKNNEGKIYQLVADKSNEVRPRQTGNNALNSAWNDWSLMCRLPILEIINNNVPCNIRATLTQAT